MSNQGSTKSKENQVRVSALDNNPAFNFLKRNLASMIALVSLFVVLSITTETFLVGNNLLSVLRQVCVNTFIAFGITCVLISGGIDLSVGSVVAAAGVISVRLANMGMPAAIYRNSFHTDYYPWCQLHINRRSACTV